MKVPARFARYLLLAALSFGGSVSPAEAQSAPEHHIWQDAGTYEPSSRTALAITGPITLSGNPDFATEGSEMTIAFGQGSPVRLISEGASWRTWNYGSDKVTAETFRMTADPGALLHGNRLCDGDLGDGSIYIVFYEANRFTQFETLQMATFRSGEPPFDINSPGLCGTYSFALATPQQAPAEVVTAALSTSRWTRTVKINPLDDTKTIALSMNATSGTSALGDPITLIARCQSQQTEVYVIWRDYLGNDGPDSRSQWKEVTVRVGRSKARVERWSISTDSEATFVGGWGGDFLKELLDQDRLVLQTVPYGENPVTAIFDVQGLRPVLGELAETCSWRF